MSFEKVLDKIQNKIDIVYIDPPYKTDFVYESVKNNRKDLLIKMEL